MIHTNNKAITCSPIVIADVTEKKIANRQWVAEFPYIAAQE